MLMIVMIEKMKDLEIVILDLLLVVCRYDIVLFVDKD